jgi:hypothetical protein
MKYITVAEAKDLINESDGEYYKFVASEDVDSSRWSVLVQVVFQVKEDGKLYAFNWERGLTEMQENTIDTEEETGAYFDRENMGYHVPVTEVQRKTREVVYYEEVNDE